MTANLTIDAIARWLVPGLVNSLWQSALITLAVAAALRVFRTSASTRAAVWFAVLMQTALLPFLFWNPGGPAENSFATLPVIDAAAASAPLAREAPEIPAKTARIILLIWFGGVSLQGLRLANGLMRLRQWKRNAMPIPTRLTFPRDARVCSSDHCETPVVIGYRRPMVLLPSRMVFSLKPADVNRILRHEMAHILRRDDWMQLAQRMAEALLFFHPVVLWIGRRLALEREIACDDHVISNNSESRMYARSLIRFAQTMSSFSAPSTAPAVFSRNNQLSRRIDMLLASNRNRSVRVSASGIALAILFFAGCLFFLAQVSPVVAVSPEENKSVREKERQSQMAAKAAEEAVLRASEQNRLAEEKMRAAAEQMKWTSERMREVSEQMQRAADQLRAVQEHRAAGMIQPNLPPAPIPELDPRPMARPELVPASPSSPRVPRPYAPPTLEPAPSAPLPPVPELAPTPGEAPEPPEEPEAPLPRDRV